MNEEGDESLIFLGFSRIRIFRIMYAQLARPSAGSNLDQRLVDYFREWRRTPIVLQREG